MVYLKAAIVMTLSVLKGMPLLQAFSSVIFHIGVSHGPSDEYNGVSHGPFDDKTVRPSEKVSEGVKRKPGSKN